MRSADQYVMLLLDDIDALVANLRRIYPAAVSSAEAVHLGRQSTGVPVRTSGTSDPTGEAATDPRRGRRQANLKRARKEIKAALTAAQSALAHTILAADR